MKYASVLFIVACAGLFAWAMPQHSRERTESGAALPDTTASLSVMEDVEPVSGEVILPRADDGHFYAEVTVDGVASKMLVDTGASVTALTGADAEAIGIEWQREDVRQVARGASGPVYGVPVTLATVQLGEFEVQSTKGVVIPQGLEISLLGQSFLSHIGRVEIEDGQMTLAGEE